MQEFEDKLRLAFAAVTQYYDESTLTGADTPPPTDLIRNHMAVLLQEFNLEVNRSKTVEIELSDDKLKNVYGEDWLTYRDDRLKELKDEQDYIRASVPNGPGGAVDVQPGSAEKVETLPTDQGDNRRGQSDSGGEKDSRSDSIVINVDNK